MSICRLLGVLILIISFTSARAEVGDDAVPQVSPQGVLAWHGRPYRAIGVNYYNAFYRTLADAKDRSYEQGFADLKEHHIPFARFSACGYWPSEMKLYVENREEYFRRLDGVIRAAEKNHIGLIPDFCWTIFTVPDLVGESCNQWGVAGSRTRQFMRQFTREVVGRYKDSPAIWAWEFGNEFNLAADLPNAREHRPPVQKTLGTPTTRSSADEITHDMFRGALVDFAREVRKLDSRRMISSGNSVARPSAWHQQHESSWKPDTQEQWSSMLLADNPDPLNVLSVHIYDEDLVRFTWALQAAKQSGKPLFVGEFGVEGSGVEVQKKFQQMLDAIEHSEAALAAVWVYDYGSMDNWNITAKNARSEQLRVIEEANQRMGLEKN